MCSQILLIFQELENCQSVILSINDELGVRCLVDELLVAMGRETGTVRWAAVTLLFIFCQHTKSDYSEHVPQLFRGILSLFTDTDEAVLHAGWDCLNAIVKVTFSSVVSTYECIPTTVRILFRSRLSLATPLC